MIKVSLFYKTYDFYDIDCDENEDEFDDEDDIIELDKDILFLYSMFVYIRWYIQKQLNN